MQKFIFLTDLIYNIAFKKKQSSKSYRLWLNVPKNYISLSMFFAVNWLLYGWIQHHALHNYHYQLTKFQWNLLHGLRAYAALVEWFQSASFHESKPVNHVCYCLNHNNIKSDFSKHCYKKWWLGYLQLKNSWNQLIFHCIPVFQVFV